MTNVHRPIHLQLRPSANGLGSPLGHSRLSSPPSSLVAPSPLTTAPRASMQAHASAPQAPVRPNALINFTPPASTNTSSSLADVSQQQQQLSISPRHRSQPKALSPSGGLNDALPSQIMPHLFVGNQEQTNRETVNKLNIKYILSLGLLPILLSSSTSTTTSVASPTSTLSTPTAGSRQAAGDATNAQANATGQQQKVLMPSQNSSKDFKIRIRSNTPTPPASATATPSAIASPNSSSAPMSQQPSSQQRGDAENKGVKSVRSIHCKCINIADNSEQLLMKFFDEACAFIEEARRKKCNILIHCLAGISRSPTIAIAYLMRVKSLHWKDAYDLVKKCRPQIDPNLNFMGQLRIYNKSLRDEQLRRRQAQAAAATNSASALNQAGYRNSRKRSNNYSSLEGRHADKMQTTGQNASTNCLENVNHLTS